MRQGLLVRIVSGLVIGSLVLLLFGFGEWGIRVLATIIGAFALWEFRNLSDRLGYRSPSWLLFPLGGYFIFSGTLLERLDTKLVLALALVGGLAAFLFLRGKEQGLARWAMGLAGAVYIGMPFNFYLLLVARGPQRGVAWVLLILIAVVVSDAAALVVGSLLGRHPFFANISPRKTVEGAVAGVLLPIVPMLIGLVVIFNLPVYHALVLGLLVGLSGEAGDLVESQMKRLAGVKDSSNLIPGHGGILDRIDSMLFPPILVFLYLSWTHLLK